MEKAAKFVLKLFVYYKNQNLRAELSVYAHYCSCNVNADQFPIHDVTRALIIHNFSGHCFFIKSKVGFGWLLRSLMDKFCMPKKIRM